MRQKSIFLYRISSIGAVKQVFIIFILIPIFLIFPEFFSYLKKSKISWLKTLLTNKRLNVVSEILSSSWHDYWNTNLDK